eukprot:TRINITY_DN19458_c0_g1_i1.p1 TRINITY_DN19458_c0_g1~~TRINITY_DN19458_c0_g1_i1.p1  ORF type:complete len:442 (+),score=72.90 TRINITY_DN19458_c0_g1_i1:357-1682(+)
MLEGIGSHPFWQFQWHECWEARIWVTSLVLYAAGILCSAAGIGGGGVYVAVIMLVGHESAYDAVPLSKAAVLSGAIVTLHLNVQRLDADMPREARRIIDFHVCRTVIPSALIGSFLGVYTNSLVNERWLVLFLTCLLLVMTLLTAKIAWRQRVDELAAWTSGELDCGERRSLVRRRSSLWVQPPVGGPLVDDPPEPSILSLMEANKRPSKRDLGSPETVDMKLIPFAMCVMVLCGVMRFHMSSCLEEAAGRGFTGACDHPVPRVISAGNMRHVMGDTNVGTGLLVLTSCLPFAVCGLVGYAYSAVVLRHGCWDMSQLSLYMFVGFVSGLLAGILGIGGGLILAPFFLFMGMEPAVCVGTSSTCVLFTALATALQYVFTDRVRMSVALVYAISTMLASLTGTHMVHWLQDRFIGNTSVISVLLVLGLATSAAFSFMKVLESF